MAKIIGLPKLSPTMDEGTLVSWAVKEGDKVEVDDLLAEVETDKATMEFRSFDAGVVLKVLVEEGATLPAEAPVAIIGEAGEDITALLQEAEKFVAPDGPAPGPAPAASGETAAGTISGTITGTLSGAGTGSARSTPAQTVAGTLSGAGTGATSPTAAAHDGRVLASPLVRRLALEHGIDLGVVTGTGPHGRIVKTDFEKYLASGAPAATGAVARTTTASRETRVEKVSQMRKTIARRLTESKRDIPHYYLTIDVDMQPLLAARKGINAELERTGEKVSVNDLLIKGVAVALRRYPAANASYRGDTIHYHGRVDISVAVAIPDGLITPVVRDADQKGLSQIGAEVRELVGRAKEKKLRPEEFTDGTFSISNLGMFGIEEFTAVINPPEGAILAVGTIRDEPVVKDGAVVPGKRMRLTMSCDHRVIDGATGAQYLQVLKRLLESPASMLI
ncbi:MAG: pyruvate dehydrogenase complex dihydrolipoamide acetyltransferase [Deltaproteobacteria bacterium]|nr:pyruvate dehydrogenase complex dihydrolipoamide acetyltransferase [Deltaproteobacteria bacterium]